MCHPVNITAKSGFFQRSCCRKEEIWMQRVDKYRNPGCKISGEWAAYDLKEYLVSDATQQILLRENMHGTKTCFVYKTT